jgi:hypothetical protein
LIRYVSAKPGKIGLDLQAGLIIGVLQSATESGVMSQQYTPYLKERGTNGAFSWVQSTDRIDSLSAIAKVGNANKYDWGLVMNIGVVDPLSNIFSLSLDIMTTYKFNSVGNGGQDIVTFNNGTVFNYYQGQYGKASSIILNLKLFIR